MKKLITLSTLFILAGFLLTSCKSGFTGTKRHYTKGYYFARNHGKTTPSTLESNAASVKTGPAEQIAEVSVLPEQTPIRTYTTPTLILGNSVLTTSNEKRQNSPGLKKDPNPLASRIMSNGPNVTYKIKNINDHITQIDLTRLNTKKVRAAASGEVLSLFWIVILVILILWLVGLLAGGWGLGGLINLLLVVALILLILWLLRVI